MTASSDSRGDRLAHIVAQFNAAHNPSGNVQPADLGVCDADVALLIEAIDSGELWHLLETRSELDLAPSEASTRLKWSDLMKVATHPLGDTEANRS
ncbi:MAG: hypothetical protein ABL985_19230 [Casimicrobium sp.]